MAVTTQALQIEIADYLLANNGPDNQGRGHHNKKQLETSDLERAIELAEARGLPKGFKPYHIKGTKYVWTEENINEVLTKKIDQLLAEKYNGDFFRLVTTTNQNELSSTFIDKLNGRDIEVSMGVIGHKLGNSTFEMLKQYIEIKGIEGYEDLKPYHLAKSTKNTFDNPEIINEVLTKKIDQLLAEKYNGDFFKLITETDARGLFSPLIDRLNGRDIEVSMSVVGLKFNCSPLKMIQKYVELKGIEGYEGLRPYHLARSSQYIFDDPKIVDEVLTKKIDQLLAEKYNGDFFRLVTETNAIELISPFMDKLNGRDIEVSMGRIGKKFNCSPLKMIQRYIELKEIEGYEGLRPYHLARSAKSTFDNPKIVDELLTKKIDQLLAEKYNGDFFRLIAETDYNELVSPYVDKLNGRDIDVSMFSVKSKFNSSPFEMLQQYAKLKTKKYTVQLQKTK